MGPGAWNRRLEPAALPDCPFANSRPASSGCFCSQITANAVIAKSEIQGFLPRPRPPCSESRRSATPVLPKPTLSPVPLFYQLHIRLGSPDSTAGCFRYLHPNNRHRSSSSNRPAQPIGAFPKLHETRTLWQFWCCPYSNERRGSPTGRGYPAPPVGPGHAVVLHHEQRKVPKERCLKAVASTPSHNSGIM
jgi:hypothetical protein